VRKGGVLRWTGGKKRAVCPSGDFGAGRRNARGIMKTRVSVYRRPPKLTFGEGGEALLEKKSEGGP